MKNKLIDIAIGSSGIGLTEIVQNASVVDPQEVTAIGNILIQIVIGIVTLFGLFKRKKDKQ